MLSRNSSTSGLHSVSGEGGGGPEEMPVILYKETTAWCLGQGQSYSEPWTNVAGLLLSELSLDFSPGKS